MIENIKPEIDGGRYAAKRVVGDTVRITAVIYSDGHDHVAARLLYRRDHEPAWRYAAFRELGNDIWAADFVADAIGPWRYTVQAWVDHFGTWVHDLHKRIDAQGTAASPHGVNLNEPSGNLNEPSADAELATAPPETAGPTAAASQAVAATNRSDVPIAFLTGAALLEHASALATGKDASTLKTAAKSLRSLVEKKNVSYNFPLSDEIIALALRYPDHTFASTYDTELPLWVDRELARFSSWYEFFPRSLSETPGVHGTLRDVVRMLPSVADMGFNILYMPPIHPIGTAFRKGKNNSTVAEPGDVGSPWAIGNHDGGHKSILRDLGTFADFADMVAAAGKLGIEIALDIAFQCSPDHPWVRQHPDWFQIRPDGTIQYAENPPKKYQDIYPLNFESADWQAMWQELFSVFDFWIERGITVFRVDNPHTKALPFWEWCISEVHKTHPEVIFLAEAFTRPHVMYGLAKMGYTQSYTYFSWRTEKKELTQYMSEVTTEPVSDFFRPSLWPNTPDILPGSLQTGGRAGFAQRAILAATLGASWGVYGPAFELCDGTPAKANSEEYLNSEKYELRHWQRDSPDSLAPLLTRLNTIRNSEPALQTNESLTFHAISNDSLICYSKRAGDSVLLTIVNLAPHTTHSGWTSLDMAALDLPWIGMFDAEDLLTGETYLWQGERNYVELAPQTSPAHILRLHPRHLSENMSAESTED